MKDYIFIIVCVNYTQKLTGGILLSRNKDFLVFYRGKDFLSPDVSEVLLEKERLAKSLQDDEEQARLRASTFITPRVETQEHSAGTLGETLDANARWGKTLDDDHEKKVLQEAEAVRQADIIRKLERKLRFVSILKHEFILILNLSLIWLLTF